MINNLYSFELNESECKERERRERENTDSGQILFEVDIRHGKHIPYYFFKFVIILQYSTEGYQFLIDRTNVGWLNAIHLFKVFVLIHWGILYLL